jgi:dTDP-4-dehydrorhamnose reductase
MKNISNIDPKKVKILILGASGMLGNAIFRYFSEDKSFDVIGTIRNREVLKFFPEKLKNAIYPDVNIENYNLLKSFFLDVRPDIVINCIGVIKQRPESYDSLRSISINSLLPHQLERLCKVFSSRLIHFSTDCIFSGNKGMYKEFDVPDAMDIYGRSKLLGEVSTESSITLRTSIIGHEVGRSDSLIEWFLRQQGSVNGFRKAKFSGLPTIEIARLIKNHVLPNPGLYGVYNVSSDPIDKFNLLQIVAKVYEKDIKIIPSDDLVIDRSLDSSLFRGLTGFRSKSWLDLVKAMHEFQ